MTTGIRAALTTAAVAALMLVGGCGAAVPVPDFGPSPSAAPAAASAPVADPTTVTIPRLGIDAVKLVGLGLDADGALAVPPLEHPEQIGWYDLGVKPGGLGPAVIVSHVNGGGHPGGFAKLTTMRVGDPITVARADGSAVRFVVDALTYYCKTAGACGSTPVFNTAAVYGNTPRPELRLITCTGEVVAHNYQENLVVSAHQES